MNPIDLFTWYLNFIMEHALIIIVASVIYVVYDFRMEAKRRAQNTYIDAVIAYAHQYGVSYEEAKRQLSIDPPK